MLCSHLALPKGKGAGNLETLRPQEWNDLAASLRERKLRPGALLDMDTAEVQSMLGLSAERTSRIGRLLVRGAQLAIELERLGTGAPVVLFGAGNKALLGQGFLAVVGSRDVDQAGESFAQAVGAVCARGGLMLVSGGSLSIAAR